MFGVVREWPGRAAAVAMWIALTAVASHGQPLPGEAIQHQDVGDAIGDLPAVLDDDDWFGSAVARGSGAGDDVVLWVGARGDDDGGPQRGAVWRLSLDADGTVAGTGKISSTSPGMGGALDDGDWFGWSVAVLGDVDDDGVDDLAVGAIFDDDGGVSCGAVWILFLDADGGVRARTKISASEGGFVGPLDAVDHFGYALAPLGDLDGDGVEDLAVGAIYDDDGGTNRGAVWILFLDVEGRVAREAKISATAGGLAVALADFDEFGSGLASLGDLDGDGVVDLAVGAMGDDGLGLDRGAFWTVFLTPDGAVKNLRRVTQGTGGFQGGLDDCDSFGNALANLGDVNGDGVVDLAVGAFLDDDGGGPTGPQADRGAVWLAFLQPDGTVRHERKLSDTQGGFDGDLSGFDGFGWSVAGLGDLDGDDAVDLVAGSILADGAPDDEGVPTGSDLGRVTVVFLEDQWVNVGEGIQAASVLPDVAEPGVVQPFANATAPARDAAPADVVLERDQPDAPRVGIPKLASFADDLVVGADVAVALADAPELSPARLLVAVLDAEDEEPAFEDGVIASEVDLAVDGLVTDALGQLEVAFAWPGGLEPDTRVVLQVVILGQGGGATVSASNALVATAP